MNLVIVIGDGIVMVYWVKGYLGNMEFVQFYLMVLYNLVGENLDFLVLEVVRGFGVIFKKCDGLLFMQKYDKCEFLVLRDIVVRVIDNEIKINGEECMFLDCCYLDEEGFKVYFLMIYDKCMSIGIDLMKDMILVVLVCYYMCGGVIFDDFGCSFICNLYICGECISIGLYGVNCLVLNLLLEVLVFGNCIV